MWRDGLISWQLRYPPSNGCWVDCWLSAVALRPTQLFIPEESVNEDQLWLARQRQITPLSLTVLSSSNCIRGYKYDMYVTLFSVHGVKFSLRYAISSLCVYLCMYVLDRVNSKLTLPCFAENSLWVPSSVEMLCHLLYDILNKWSFAKCKIILWLHFITCCPLCLRPSAKMTPALQSLQGGGDFTPLSLTILNSIHTDKLCSKKHGWAPAKICTLQGLHSRGHQCCLRRWSLQNLTVRAWTIPLTAGLRVTGHWR